MPRSERPEPKLLGRGHCDILRGGDGHRNQKPDGIRPLYTYAQLLFSISGTDARYGTTETPHKFYAAWREEELSADAITSLVNRPLTREQNEALFAERSASLRDYFAALWSRLS